MEVSEGARVTVIVGIVVFWGPEDAGAGAEGANENAGGAVEGTADFGKNAEVGWAEFTLEAESAGGLKKL